MEMFVLGGYDFTNDIVMTSYTVANVPVYEEWKDGNLRTRRYLERYRLQGSFSLKFFSVEKLNLFLDQYEGLKRNDTSVRATLYATNEKKPYTTDVFLDFTLPDLIPVIGMKDNKEISVTVTEV